MTRLAYDTDLTDAQWEILKPLILEAKLGGRPRTLDMREVINAIFYLLANGIKWRAMPHDLPKWQSIYTYFRAWEADNTWERLNRSLRTKVRIAAGRHAQPSALSRLSQNFSNRFLDLWQVQEIGLIRSKAITLENFSATHLES